MSRWSRHSLRTVRTHRSATAFARGARNGVSITRTPSERTIASKGPQNFASRSWIKNRTSSSCSSIARFRACCVTQAQSGFAVIPARWTRREPCSIQNSTYSVRSQTVSTVKKSQASTPCACARKNSAQDGPVRRGAGPNPYRRRSVRIVVAPTRTPRLRNSPWIRTQPQRGFSRASRNTNSRRSLSSGGRPAGRRAYVQFRRTNSRCQRSSVCGETTNADHRPRGNRPLAAARTTRSRRRNSGRFTLRRSTRSSCRSTAFSTSSAATAEPPTTTRTSRRTSKYTRKTITPPRSYGHHQGPDQGFRPLHGYSRANPDASDEERRRASAGVPTGTGQPVAAPSSARL